MIHLCMKQSTFAYHNAIIIKVLNEIIGGNHYGISDNLKAVRKERSISQEELAKLLNVSRQVVSKFEQGIGYLKAEK